MALKYTTVHRKIHLLDWDLGRNLVNFTGSIDEDKKKEVKKKLKLWPVDPQASGVTQVRHGGLGISPGQSWPLAELLGFTPMTEARTGMAGKRWNWLVTLTTWVNSCLQLVHEAHPKQKPPKLLTDEFGFP